MGTLGKAAGVDGAFVAGSETTIEYLLQRARSYIFTTAAPPAVACALSKSLDLIRHGDALRANLFANIARLRDGLAGLPWRLLPSATAIQPLVVGDNDAARRPRRVRSGSAACGCRRSARRRCRRARHGCASRFPPPTRLPTSTAWWPR